MMKTSKLIAWLLTLLGFGSAMVGCSKMYAPPDDGGGMLMYGPVQVPFVVKGAVTDADDKPLENVRIVLKIKDDEPVEGRFDRRRYRDTVYTDAKGEFLTNTRPRVPLPMELIATDIDGAENGGEFESLSEEFHVNENMAFEEGRLVKTIDFTLTEKENENQ